MTACNDCKFLWKWAFGNICVSGDEKVFDCLTGKMVPVITLSNIPPKGCVSCEDKNKGDCPDFTPIGSGGIERTEDDVAITQVDHFVTTLLDAVTRRYEDDEEFRAMLDARAAEMEAYMLKKDRE